jgi:hypothetical protein
MVGDSYSKLKVFVKKYPMAVTWFRLKKHCNVIDKHLNPGEEILFIFAGQLDNNQLSFFNTGVVAFTNQRIIIAQNRLIVGYMFSSVTYDLYNDMQVYASLIWGSVCIDTVKEQIYVSNLDKKSLPEIETNITTTIKDLRDTYSKREDESK